MAESDESARSQRWQRRHARRLADRNRVQKHGVSIKRVYRDAILKRVRAKKHK
jgi:hypothetical protein